MPDALPRMNVPFPIKGISENYQFDVQEPGTTRDAQNVRGIDPTNGRTRGAQRSGLNRFLDDTHVGAGKIAEIIEVPLAQTGLTYTKITNPDQGGTEEIFSKALPNKEDCADIKIDEFGNVYVLQSVTGVVKYNQDGVVLATIPLPESDASGAPPNPACVAVDPFQNVYVGRGLTSGSAQMSDSRLYAFEFQADGTYKLAWSIDSGRYFEDAALYQKADGQIDLLCLENDDVAFASYFTVYPNIDITETPEEDTAKQVTLHDTASDDTVVYGRRMAVRKNGVVYATGGTEGTTDANLEYRLWKLNPYGDAPTSIIAELDNDTPSGGDVGVAGLGFGVAVGPDNSDGDPTLYVCGNSGALASGESAAKLRRIVDTGTAFNESGTDAFNVNWTEDFIVATVESRRVRMATDKNGSVYVPVAQGSSGQYVRAFTSSGAAIEEIFDTDTGAVTLATAVAVPRTIPDGAPATAGDKTAYTSAPPTEFVFWGTDVGTSSVAFYKTRMLEVRNTNAPASFAGYRTFKRLAIGVGDIETFTQGGAFATPTGGSDALLDASGVESPYVQATVGPAVLDDGLDPDDPDKDKEKGRLRVYITDGLFYKKYDPEDNEVTDWTSRKAGVIPPRCKLIETWQGRVVLARDPENPTAWHMSAINDAEDWDTAPQNPSPAMAVSGFNSKIGNVPDVVNAIVPWDDDLLLFGCDHSIWSMRGNPLMGGQFDQVTDKHGMAWGRPWTKDHTGQVLFYADNLGGVHALTKGSAPVRISRDRIERRIADAVDHSSVYLRLAWNRRDEGLHVIQCPFGAGGTLLEHWFYDSKNDSWWSDRFGATGATEVQPTAVYISDGDQANDRVLLFGCEDGRIRAWDNLATSDDNVAATTIGTGHSGSDVAIDSYVVIGPLQPRGATLETQFQEMMAVLGTEYSGCHYDIFVDDEPERALAEGLVASGSLSAGRNPLEIVKFVGDVAYIRLRNASAAQRWAFEKLSFGVAAAGHQVVR